MIPFVLNWGSMAFIASARATEVGVTKSHSDCTKLLSGAPPPEPTSRKRPPFALPDCAELHETAPWGRVFKSRPPRQEQPDEFVRKIRPDLRNVTSADGIPVHPSRAGAPSRNARWTSVGSRNGKVVTELADRRSRRPHRPGRGPVREFVCHSGEFARNLGVLIAEGTDVASRMRDLAFSLDNENAPAAPDIPTAPEVLDVRDGSPPETSWEGEP